MKNRLKALILSGVMLFTGSCAGNTAHAGTAESATTTTAAATEPAAPEPVFRTAQEIAADMGLGWNLGNTMEAYQATGCEKITFEWIPVIGDNTPSDYEICWGAPVTTQEMIDGVKAAGFNTVRIPVFWGNMMENDGTWTINSDYIGRVKEIVDYCMKDDL